MSEIDYRELPESWWKLYRQERVKLAKAKKPGTKKPFQIVLTAAEITRAAREANRRFAERGQR